MVLGGCKLVSRMSHMVSGECQIVRRQVVSGRC